VAGCEEGGHVKNGADLGAPAANMALATKLAAVVIEWSYSGERSGLCVGKGAEFGHEAQEGGCGDLADALDLLKAGDFGLKAWRGFDFLGDEFLKVVGLFFQAGNGFFNNHEN